MTSFGLLPEGLRDRLPPQAQALASLVRTLTDVCAAHGYERVAPPLIEYEASLASGSSRESQVVRCNDLPIFVFHVDVCQFVLFGISVFHIANCAFDAVDVGGHTFVALATHR